MMTRNCEGIRSVMESETLRTNPAGEDFSRQYLGMLRASAESLSRTFDDILDLCRMDVGRVTLENQPLDLRDLGVQEIDQPWVGKALSALL